MNEETGSDAEKCLTWAYPEDPTHQERPLQALKEGQDGTQQGLCKLCYPTGIFFFLGITHQDFLVR